MAQMIDPKKVKELLVGMDPQEEAERTEAMKNYAGEDPQHFINYVEDCVKESQDSTEDIRRVQDECWKSYLNQIDYSNKEDWQAKIVTNKPFQTIKGAMSVIRKAFESPTYLSISDLSVGGMDIAPLVKKALDYWLSDQNANFPIAFADAVEMSFITGQSSELIPSWDNKKGLVIDLIPPWQIWRDPDAKSRDPWSGNYWIHEEWLDKWVLKEGEKEGIYLNINKLVEDTKGSQDREKAERRRSMYWKRSQYRHSVLTREFFGVVLDKKGDLLLPNCTFTVAGGEIIREPKENPFVRMRWPGTSFSPFPHLTRYQGRGILEGVLSLWWILCNLMNLHVDNLAWTINKIRELNPNSLIDPRDAGEIFPGKLLLKNTNDQVLQVVTDPGSTAEVLPNIQNFNQEWDNGAFVNQFILGLPGTRTNITKGEVQIKTQQSLGIFDSIGIDIEQGAVHAMWAIIETLILNWTRESKPSITAVLGEEYAKESLTFMNMSIDDRKKILESQCELKVSGISASLEKADLMEKLKYFTTIAESSIFGPYIKPYELLATTAQVMDSEDAKFLATEDEAKQIQEALNAPQPSEPIPAQGGGIVPSLPNLLKKPIGGVNG